ASVAAGTFSNHSAVTESAGFQERGCSVVVPTMVLVTRCAWSGASAETIGSCVPPSCPTGWSDLGVTGNVKTAASGAEGTFSNHSAVTESAGYQERTCTQ
ncbi:MAG: hypothetical protein VX498_14680, partial [Myxococcota bacterium]|nr:hypothetical protein [Myxococcota bacterium]